MHFDPDFAFKGVKTKRPFTIGTGPNNPVGSVWIDLSIESYGIHGTPEPGKIGTSFSHSALEGNFCPLLHYRGQVVGIPVGQPDTARRRRLEISSLSSYRDRVPVQDLCC